MKDKLKLSAILERLAPDFKLAVSTAFKNPAETEVERKSTSSDWKDLGNRQTEGYASTFNMDRDCEVLDPAGCDYVDYMTSPVILQFHNYTEMQIGKAVAISLDNTGVKIQMEFAPKDANENAEEWYNMSKFMPLTFSVGFHATERYYRGQQGFDDALNNLIAKYPGAGGSKDKINIITTKWYLIEVSIVPVPCNINAIQTALTKAAAVGLIKTNVPEPVIIPVQTIKTVSVINPVTVIDKKALIKEAIKEEIARRKGRV